MEGKQPKRESRKVKNQGMNWIRPEKRLALYLRDGLACCYCGEAVEDGAKRHVTFSFLPVGVVLVGPGACRGSRPASRRRRSAASLGRAGQRARLPRLNHLAGRSSANKLDPGPGRTGREKHDDQLRS